MVDPLTWGTKRTRRILVVVILLAMGVFPLVGDDYNIVLVSRIICLSILAISLDLLWGYTGLLSFGHGVFFGIGSYSLGLTLKYFSFPGVAYIGVLIGISVSVIAATILGYFLFYGRISGVYFCIITLALTTIFFAVGNHPGLFHILGGNNGLVGPFLYHKFGIPGVWEYQRTMVSYLANYYTALVVFLMVFAFCYYLVKSPFGKILQAIKNNEERLEYLGYNVANFKIVIFAIACGLAALSGSISVPLQTTNPVVFGLLFNASIIIWIAVGGRGTLLGPAIGTLLVNYMEIWLSSEFEYLWVFLMGVFFILVIVFQPDGLLGLNLRLRKLVRSSA